MSGRYAGGLPEHRPPVFVIGNFVQACCWRVPRLPRAGETLEATELTVEAGGKGLNVAVCLHRLGACVQTLIGCGDDSAADGLIELFRREGMCADHIYRLGGASGWGAGLIAADGQNAIAVFPGANLLLGPVHARRAETAIVGARLVYGQFETAASVVAAVFAQAHDKGVETVLNPSPWQVPEASLRQHTRIVIVNEVEAAALLGIGSALHDGVQESLRAIWPALERFWVQWPAARCLVVTLGERGALGFTRTNGANRSPPCWHVAALEIEAVDTIGAGDAFASGFCAARLAGRDIPEALVWGNACGAYVAAQRGVLDALPDRGTLERLLDRELPGARPIGPEGSAPLTAPT